MKISEVKLRQIILQEVHGRLVKELIDEELFRILLEQDDDISDEEYLELWKKKPSFRQRVRDTFDNFDALSSLKKKAAIVVMGMMAAGLTDFAGKTAAQAQADQLAAEFRADQEEAKAKSFGTLEDVRNFRDAAQSEIPVLSDTDAEGIQQARDKFMAMGVQEAPIISDLAVGTGEQRFAYTPADNIPDDTVLPFVGMTKADWEVLVRRWLTSPGGVKKIERYIGTRGKSQALFWAYGPREQLFSYAVDDADPGNRGMWLPPEWSVAYDVVQKNKARSGQPSPEDDLGIPTAGGPDVWKESLRKYLHHILNVL
jgi:hypothetical protein